MLLHEPRRWSSTAEVQRNVPVNKLYFFANTNRILRLEMDEKHQRQGYMERVWGGLCPAVGHVIAIKKNC